MTKAKGPTIMAPQYAGKTAAEMNLGAPMTPLETGQSPESRLMDESEGPAAISDEVALEAFMREEVVVILIPSSDKNAPAVVPFGVNGRTIWVQPGVNTKVQRCYVERMARAKSVSISQNLDPGQGEKLNTLYRRQGIDYNFQVVRDDNPRGAAWLNKVMQEP